MSDPIVVGSKVRITGTLLVDGVETEPTTFRIEITDPTLVVTTYVWGVDAEVVQVGVDTGEFYFDLNITQPGTWLYSWFSNSTLTAVESGSVTTASTYTVRTVDDSASPVVVPFADVKVYDLVSSVCTLQTNATGNASLPLAAGTYRFVATKVGYTFPHKLVTLVTPGVVPDVAIVGFLVHGGWLTVADLETVVQVQDVDRLFHDDNSGQRNPILMQNVMQEAEALVESMLLRSWSAEQIINLAFHDQGIRSQAAWIAMELASERRGEFIAADGRGRYWTQHDRAIKYFDDLSKSKIQSRGERASTKAGVQAGGINGNTGGNRLPLNNNGQADWVFSNESDGKGHGGF